MKGCIQRKTSSVSGIKAAGEEPWVSAYQLLVESQFSQKTADTYPTEWIKRGISGDENYMNAARGATIVYQQALRWKIEQDDEYAAKAVENLNKWVQTCVGVTGNTNLSLAAGLYGYEFAIAGELLRDYGGWDRADFAAFQNWLLKVFYPANDDFLKRHHDTNALHYWANWCLCNIAAKMAIGIVTDRRDIYNEGIAHLQTGDTNGRLRRAIYHDYAPDYNFAQWQESGRDQGHTLMCVGLMGIICQLAWSQETISLLMMIISSYGPANMPLAVIIPMRLYHILLIYGKNRVNGDIRFRKNKQHLVAVNGSNVRYGRCLTIITKG